jgi:hypothetical protein
MRLRPVALGAIEADVVAQQQLGQPVAGAHQIAAQVLTRADQVAQRLFLDGRDRDRVQLARDQQPHQPLGVALVGLDAIARSARHQPRRAHQTLDPCRRQPSRERKPCGPRLIGRAHRTRQARHERRHLLTATGQPPPPQLAGLTLHHRGHRSRHVHIEPDPGLSLRHVGTPMIAVRAQATPEPQTRAAHARVPTLTPEPDRPAAKTDGPYGLARPRHSPAALVWRLNRRG